MSFITDFVREMSPSMKTADIMEDLRVSLKEIDQVLIPMYENAASTFSTCGIRSDEARDLASEFYHEYKTKRGKKATFINEIAVALKDYRENVEHVSQFIKANFTSDVFSEAITTKAALVVRAASLFTFINRYASDLLIVVSFYESQRFLDDSQAIRPSPVAVKRVSKHIGKFARLLHTYAEDNKDFEKRYSAAPEVVIGKKGPELLAMYGVSEMDPLGDQVGVQGFINNPIYHVRLFAADWQDRRYKENQEKLAALQMRLLYLKNLAAQGKADPKIEKEISYIQKERLGVIEADLLEYERDLGIDANGTKAY